MVVVLPSSLANERVSRKDGKISLRASKAFRSTLALFIHRMYASLNQSLKLLESLGSITDSFPIHQLCNFICHEVSKGDQELCQVKISLRSSLQELYKSREVMSLLGSSTE